MPESFSSSTAFRNNASEAPHHLIEGRQDGETITNGQAEIEDRGIITDPGPPGNRARCRTCAASSPLCPLYGPIAHPDASGSKRPLITQCLGFVNIENAFFVPI